MKEYFYKKEYKYMYEVHPKLLDKSLIIWVHFICLTIKNNY